MSEALLTPQEAANLWNDLVRVERPASIVRTVSAQRVREMCAAGALQAIGIRVEHPSTGWLISRGDLRSYVYRWALATAIRRADEAGMTKGERYAAIDGFVAEWKTHIEQTVEE